MYVLKQKKPCESRGDKFPELWENYNKLQPEKPEKTPREQGNYNFKKLENGLRASGEKT